MSRFFCLNISDFSAWAAAQHDAALAGRAFVIGVSGRLQALSPEAQRAGIKQGWTWERAQALVPGLLHLPYNSPEVQASWEDTLWQLYSVTSRVESLRPGLAYADIIPSDNVVPLVRRWGARGGGARGGIADDRTTAHVAAISALAGSVRTIRADRGEAFLQQADVRLLETVGVASDTIERCGWFGWDTIGALRRASKRQLLLQFPEGELLHRYAQGNDRRPVPFFKPPVYLTAHCEFEQAVREPCEWEPALAHLVETTAAQLGEYRCHIVRVQIEAGGRHLQQRRLVRDGAANGRLLLASARAILDELLPSGADISRLEIGLGGLALPAPLQLGLFRTARPSVITVIHAIEKRFPGVAKRVVIADANAYLPEDGYRLEPLQLEGPTKTAPKPKTASRKKQPTPHYQRRGKQQSVEQLVLR